MLNMLKKYFQLLETNPAEIIRLILILLSSQILLITFVILDFFDQIQFIVGYDLNYTLLMFISIAISLGIHQTYGNRFFKENDKNINEISYIILISKIFFPIFIISYFFFEEYLLFVIGGFFAAVRSIYQVYFTFSKKVHHYLRYEIFGIFLYFFGLFFGLKNNYITVNYLISIHILMWLIYLHPVWLNKSKFKIKSRLNFIIIISKSFPLWLISLATFALAYTDRVAINQFFLDDKYLLEYVNISRFYVSLISGGLIIVGSIYSRRIYRLLADGMKAEAQTTTNKSFLFFVFIGLIGVVLISFLMRYLNLLMFGEISLIAFIFCVCIAMIYLSLSIYTSTQLAYLNYNELNFSNFFSLLFSLVMGMIIFFVFKDYGIFSLVGFVLCGSFFRAASLRFIRLIYVK